MREVSELELTFTQFKTLMLLAHEPEALSVKDVSDRLGISFPAASRAVEPLVSAASWSAPRTRTTAA